MRDVEIGRIARALRIRRGWRQADLAQRAGLHRSVVSLIERGKLERMRHGTLRRVLTALEVRLVMRLDWRGPELDRLLDASHATMVAAWVTRLEAWGWRVWVEVSFNQYGERGRIDIVGWHPVSRAMLIAEIKTDMVDAQDLLGSMDVRTRLGPVLARQLNLPTPEAVVPALVFREDRTVRRRVERLAALFGRYDLRGRAAVSWLRHPEGAGAPRGLLLFSELSTAVGSRAIRPGRQRVRLPRTALTVNPTVSAIAAPSEAG
ncbi:MAG: helix-turn-helix domain-containing protein [Candidatus Limnocylindria bacterium]